MRRHPGFIHQGIFPSVPQSARAGGGLPLPIAVPLRREAGDSMLPVHPQERFSLRTASPTLYNVGLLQIHNRCFVPLHVRDHLFHAGPHSSRADLCCSAAPAPHRAYLPCLCGPCMERYACRTGVWQLWLDDVAPARQAAGTEGRIRACPPADRPRSEQATGFTTKTRSAMFPLRRMCEAVLLRCAKPSAERGLV